MIFGRYDDRGEQQTPRPAPAVAGAPATHHTEPQTAPRVAEGGAGGERPPRPLYPEQNRS
jgi:hypothetical protein